MIFWAKNMSPFFLLHFPILLTEREIIYNRNKCKFKAFYPVLKHFSPFFPSPFKFFPLKLKFFFLQRQTPLTTTPVYCIINISLADLLPEFRDCKCNEILNIQSIHSLHHFGRIWYFIRDGQF